MFATRSPLDETGDRASHPSPLPNPPPPKNQVIPAIQASTSATVTVVASRDTGRAREFASRFGITGACTYEEVLTREDVDAVYVPLPSGLKNEWCRQAAMAGKHVYAEKPMSGSVSGLRLP